MMPTRQIRFARKSITTAAVLALAMCGSTFAGFVTWNAPTTLSGDNDVSLNGSLVAAFNLGGPNIAATTVRGVTFDPFAMGDQVNVSGNFKASGAIAIDGVDGGLGAIVAPFSALSNDYQELLDSAALTFADGTSTTNIILEMASLTIGRQYEFQWWANASKEQNAPLFNPSGAPPPPIAMTTATAGGSVSLFQTGATAGSVGQFAIGTFTADSAIQTITFSALSGRNVVNAFQLRDLSAPAVPEPGTCLFGIALSGFVATFRRRI